MKRAFYSDPFPSMETGLPVMIWIGTKENGDQPRIWVEENGKYHPVHFAARRSQYPDVSAWIKVHIESLTEYWNGIIDTTEFVKNAIQRNRK